MTGCGLCFDNGKTFFRKGLDRLTVDARLGDLLELGEGGGVEVHEG